MKRQSDSVGSAIQGPAGPAMIGVEADWPMRGDPSLDGSGAIWLAEDGRALSRAIYAVLFGVLVPSLGTVTVTLASPGVFTTPVAHGLVPGDSVYLTTTGALPTGLAANTLYYVLTTPSATTFTLTASLTAFAFGVAINTSGSQSGVHTLKSCPYGLGDGATTFNIPDYRGRFGLYADNMGTAAGGAGRLPNSHRALGRNQSGEERHKLNIAELAAHNHIMSARYPANFGGVAPQIPYLDSGDRYSSFASDLSGGDTPHNNMPPYTVGSRIIRVL